jgi:hypothetical protein
MGTDDLHIWGIVGGIREGNERTAHLGCESKKTARAMMGA